MVRLFPLAGAQPADDSVSRWFAESPSPLKVLAKRWFDEWRACGPDVDELLHDRHPTVCVRGIALGYVNAFTSHVNVGFFLGSTLHDPDHLLEGTGKFMRHVKVRPSEQGRDDALRSLLRGAYRDLKARLAGPRSLERGRNQT